MLFRVCCFRSEPERKHWELYERTQGRGAEAKLWFEHFPPPEYHMPMASDAVTIPTVHKPGRPTTSHRTFTKLIVSWEGAKVEACRVDEYEIVVTSAASSLKPLNC